jgi:phosphatidylserine/phosphatidylglycerophosphate/cardiolipin synthase-like enzyme
MIPYRVIAEESVRLARLLPSSVVEAMAAGLQFSGDAEWSTLRARIAQGVPSPHQRALAVAFLDMWRSDAGEVPSQAVASSLLTAALANRDHRESQAVELVWTGPDSGAFPLRRTEQAMLQVIDSATSRLLVVSYAVYNIPRVRDALVQAADRGVTLSIVVESPDRQAGRDAYDTLRALGPAVASRSRVYRWPHETRPRDENARSGLLHVKCLASDGRRLFLSSANLTEYAFTINMELGLLITGGKLPGQVESHFDLLIAKGIFTSP